MTAAIANHRITPAPPLAVGDAEAARLLSVSTRTLFNWRVDGSGPRYVKAGGRVLYAVDELRRWLDAAAEPSPSKISPAMQATGTPPATQPQTGKQPAKQAISDQTGGAS